MKKNIFIIITQLILLFHGNLVHAQKDTNNDQALQMLKEFYTEYNTAWIRWLGVKDNSILVKKIDSLEKKYCSLKMRAELKKEFKASGLDYDILRNNEGADEKSLKTLTVVKDKMKKYTYIVSYIYDTMSPSYKPITATVVIHIAVTKEKDGYKIDAVW